MRALVLLLSLLLIGGDTEYRHCQVYRPGSFKQHWGVVIEAAYSFPPGHATEKPIELFTTARRFKATVQVSDVGKVAYSDAVASIAIERFNGDKTYIVMEHFRVVRVQWVNDRLLFIKAGLGHVAGLDQIFDAEAGKWIYQQGVSYSKMGPPDHSVWDEDG